MNSSQSEFPLVYFYWTFHTRTSLLPPIQVEREVYLSSSSPPVDPVPRAELSHNMSQRARIALHTHDTREKTFSKFVRNYGRKRKLRSP